MRQMSLGVKFFWGKPSSVGKELMKKKANSVSCLQKKYKKVWTGPSQWQQQQQISCKISNMNIEILRIHEDYVTTTFFIFIFTLMLLNGLPVLGGTRFSKPITDMPKEELNVFRKNFCTSARNKDGTLSVSKIHQWNPSESRHWSFPSLAAVQSDPAFTEANKALKHLQKTSEK